MLLKDKQSGDLVEIAEVHNLIDPTQDTITAQIQAGQNEQPPASFTKDQLIFPSGETLPRCWVDADYRRNMPAE